MGRKSAELFYLFPEGGSDNPHQWSSEAGYFKGLGEDAGESVTMTPTGAPSSSQASNAAATSSGGFFQSFANAAQQLLPVAANVYAQKKFTDLNLARAQAGQPLVSAAQFQQMYPTATVAVGPNETAKKLLMWGAIGIGGLVALRALKVI